MASGWQAFLTGNGARIEGNSVQDFGRPKDETRAAVLRNFITDLSSLAIVVISGANAEVFLQGQFTSDIRKLHDACFQFSAWCNPKGRVIANFIIFRLNNRYFLLLPDELKQSFIKKLQMYVLRADVSIDDRGNELIRMGILARDRQRLQVAGLGDVIRKHSMKIIRHHELNVIPLHGEGIRMIVVGPEQPMRQLWQTLTQDFVPVGSRYWQLQDVLSGFAWINKHSSESLLPQSLNLDCLDGVSFDKGCYTGQEIVGRLHYRGRLKQRLFLASLPPDTPADTGTRLYMQKFDHPIGTIVNAAIHPEKGLQVLAVVDIDKAGSNRAHLGNVDGPVLDFEPLPYPVEKG
ncbi:MAG: YgfZ/GcvT domain-containing protein [Gammaproteobacteria bacterium]